MSERPLKLLARDSEDVQVIAAVLQDAIAPLCEISYRASEKNFLMLVQRFQWDDLQNGGEAGSFARINCVLDVQGVESVQFLGLDPEVPSTMLELLTLVLEGDTLRFFFAGEGQIRLNLGNWSLKVRDFGDSWPVACRPCHAT